MRVGKPGVSRILYIKHGVCGKERPEAENNSVIHMNRHGVCGEGDQRSETDVCVNMYYV